MTRRALDFYETAPWQVDALVDYLPELNGTIWCPCVGDGSIVRRLKSRCPNLGPFVTMDVDPTKPADFHADMTLPASWDAARQQFGGPPDWVVDNPPFSVALPIAQLAHDWARRGVVLMTRISFVEPTRDRGGWLRTHPRDLAITLERYSFTGTGSTDSATTAWQVWAKHATLRHRGNVSAFGYRDGSRGLDRIEASA